MAEYLVAAYNLCYALAHIEYIHTLYVFMHTGMNTRIHTRTCMYITQLLLDDKAKLEIQVRFQVKVARNFLKTH